MQVYLHFLLLFTLLILCSLKGVVGFEIAKVLLDSCSFVFRRTGCHVLAGTTGGGKEWESG